MNAIARVESKLSNHICLTMSEVAPIPSRVGRNIPCDPNGGCVAHRWYVIESAPRHEFHVLAALASLRCYLPIEVVQRKKLINRRPVLFNGKFVMEPVLRPFFPGYLFAHLDLSQPDWAIIFRTPNVRGMLRDAYSRPIPVPDGVIEAIMARGRAGDGAIDLSFAPAFPVLEPNQVVKVLKGPFQDIEAIVVLDAADRVKVLLSMFGRNSIVELDRANVHPIPAVA